MEFGRYESRGVRNKNSRNSFLFLSFLKSLSISDVNLLNKLTLAFTNQCY